MAEGVETCVCCGLFASKTKKELGVAFGCWKVEEL